MKSIKKIKGKYLIIIFIIILIILSIIYGNIINTNIKYNQFSKENMKVYENNKEKVFKVDKILICSSANAVDLSEKKNLQDMSIYQYTDIAIYIDNGEELSNKNTVKQLYIDNISLDGSSDIGLKSLGYKNILKFGLKKDTNSSTQNEENTTSDVFARLTGGINTTSNTIDVGNITTDEENSTNSEENELDENTNNTNEEKQETSAENLQNEKIDFNIIYTNEENDKADYNNPTFYTDCSNPITLEYLNNDIATHYKMDENKSVAFDGSILQDAGISTDCLKCKVKFKINIINNDNEKYSCWVNFDIPLDDIYEGTTMKAKTTNSEKYVFFRE